jgi:Zn-dependent protease
VNETERPPIVVPPVVSPPPGESGPPASGPEKGNWLKSLGPVGVFLVAAGKWLVAGLKLLKGAKFLVTGLSMLLSVWVYAQWYGWSFGVGFVLSILVHELGHVFFAWRQGVPVTAPLFIPGMGALIVQKRGAQSAFGEALIGIGGPLFGALAALACWGIYAMTGNGLFLALAYTGFFVNLFNLAPIFPLDGGWITACLSPYVVIVGYVLLIAAAVTGTIRNPMIYILAIMSIPYAWNMIRRGTMDPEGGKVTTGKQRWGMGVAYMALAGFLAWAMGHTHYSDRRLQEHIQKPRAVAMNGERG